MSPTFLRVLLKPLCVTLYVTGFVLLYSGITAGAAGQRRQTPAAPPPSVEQQVLQASSEWADAASKNDVEALDRLLADDYVTIQQTGNSLGLIEKPVQLDSARKAAVAPTKTTRALSRVRVKVYGNVAILTALASYETQVAAGGVQRTQGFVSEVWVNIGGRWRLTHFQPTLQVVPRSGGPGAPAR
jgi:ketosteroid isomerase-like protein